MESCGAFCSAQTRHNNVEDESWCMAVAGVFTFIFDIFAKRVSLFLELWGIDAQNGGGE
jgi:hypothetical protein